jgi:endonuclease/exonuclease/phosphatase family metal-dependent hydrolase
VRLLAWNIHWCRGTDRRVDPGRIAAEVRRLADPDIACLQEVACNFADLPGSAGEDQVEALARELPGCQFAYGFGVDVPDGAGGRKRFGNLIVSRLPVLRVLRHSLPWPADPQAPSMPRVAVEAVIEAGFGPIRVVTTHLEYYSARQRAAQVERLRELHAEACAQARRPVLRSDEAGPFEPQLRPSAAILCGDLNMPPEDPSYARLVAPFDDATPRCVDAWRHAHPGAVHPPTFRLYERDPGEMPYCCDYVLVSEDLAPRIAAVRVDAATQASDHQPVIVEFRD